MSIGREPDIACTARRSRCGLVHKWHIHWPARDQVIDKKDGKSHVAKRTDRPYVRVIPGADGTFPALSAVRRRASVVPGGPGWPNLVTFWPSLTCDVPPLPSYLSVHGGGETSA